MKELNEEELAQVNGGIKKAAKWNNAQCSILNESNCKQHTDVCKWEANTCKAR